MNLQSVLNTCPEPVREYLYYLEGIKSRSPRTVYGYAVDLRLFTRFLYNHRNPDTAPEKLSKLAAEANVEFFGKATYTEIMEFLHFTTHDRANQEKARCRKISVLRGFFGYLFYKIGVIKSDPTAPLDAPKVKKSLPVYLTLEQSKTLLAHAKESSARNFCITTLFLGCGLRLSELCSINISHISENKIKILGKGNKEREIFLSPACLSAIDDYVSGERKEAKKIIDTDALFIRPSTGLRLGVRGVQYMLEHLFAESGLAGLGFTPHKLRHTAATLMYVHGKVDIRTLGDVLGHENLATTQIYTHVANEQVKEAFMSNPLADFDLSEEK